MAENALFQFRLYVGAHQKPIVSIALVVKLISSLNIKWEND